MDKRAWWTVLESVKTRCIGISYKIGNALLGGGFCPGQAGTGEGFAGTGTNPTGRGKAEWWKSDTT